MSAGSLTGRVKMIPGSLSARRDTIRAAHALPCARARIQVDTLAFTHFFFLQILRGTLDSVSILPEIPERLGTRSRHHESSRRVLEISARRSRAIVHPSVFFPSFPDILILSLRKTLRGHPFGFTAVV